jgi:hypothetical protein
VAGALFNQLNEHIIKRRCLAGIQEVSMVICRNCGRKTEGDYCQWCGYPVMAGGKRRVETGKSGEGKKMAKREVEQGKGGEYPSRLGGLVCSLDNKYVCENGIYEKDFWGNKKTIIWDEVDRIFINATKTTLNFIMPAGETMMLRVLSIEGNEINLSVNAIFRVGGKDKDGFFNIYQFIVSKIIDKQWAKLASDIKEGKRVSFQSFDITSEAIYRKNILH